MNYLAGNHEYIDVLDLGISNIASIHRMISSIGGHSRSIYSERNIYESSKLIIPGVGNFAKGMDLLKSKSLDKALISHIKQNKIPVLGICLGMQLMCKHSEEGDSLGLGLIDANVKKLPIEDSNDVLVPHMGWNLVVPSSNDPIFSNELSDYRYYFIHSYYVSPVDQSIVIGKTNYGSMFCSVYRSGNIYGVQFHPEKSHRFGKSLLSQFLRV